MEKTVQITIGDTQFNLTESAYDALSSYLERLKSRFLATPDGAEILSDIESRIAEKLHETKHRMITVSDVNVVMNDIGDIAAFDDADADQQPPAPEAATSGIRKLYRNPDDAILAGVASGLASYFGVSALIMRIIFFVSIFFSGFGIFIYIVLWLIVPEAKTSSQKLEMKGAPVTLENISQIVKDRVEEAKTRDSFSRVARFPADVIRLFSSRFFPIVAKIAGVVLTFGAFCAAIAATAVFGIIVVNWNASWNDIPHKEIISSGLLKTLVAFAYIAVLIPLFFVFSLGLRWLRGHTIVTTAVGFGLMGIWALSLVGSGVLTTRLVGDYYAYTTASPEYAQTVDIRELSAFQQLKVERTFVDVVQGETYSAKIEGRKIDMENVVIENEGGVLTVRSAPRDNAPCLFCHTRTPHVTITVPSIDTLSVVSGVVSLELAVPVLTVNADRANINGALQADRTVLSLKSSTLELELESASTTLDITRGHAQLEGSGTSMTATARNATVEADAFRTERAVVDVSHSFMHLNSTQPVTVVRNDSSIIENAGSAAGVSETSDEL